MLWRELKDQPCSFARTLSVIGDRWSLMILRDSFLKVRKFDDFQERLGIARPILTDRLKKLVENDVLIKVPYQQKPTRYAYHLTPKGLDLYPVIMGIVHWGDKYMQDKDGPPLLHHHKPCGHDFAPVTSCSACQAELSPHDVSVRAGPGSHGSAHIPLAIS